MTIMIPVLAINAEASLIDKNSIKEKAIAKEKEKSIDEKIKDIQKLKKEVKENLKNSPDKSTSDFIKKLEIVEDLMIIKNQAEKKQLDQDKANKQASKLLKELDKFYIDSESTFSETSRHHQDIQTVSHIQSLPTSYFKTTTQSKFNCDNVNYDYGYNFGAVKPLDLEESYVVYSGGYPSSISVLQNNYCTEKDYDSGYVKIRNLSTGNICQTTINPYNDSDQGYCWKFGLGAPVLASAMAYYEGFTPFNITEGYDYFEVGK